MAKSLRKANLDELVLQSGRELESLARELVPEPQGPDGKPLTLGPRMYQLKAKLSPEAWGAFHRWSTARNAYVHGESSTIGDRDAFYADYQLLRRELEDLSAVDDEGEGSGIVGVVLFVVFVVVVALVAC